MRRRLGVLFTAVAVAATISCSSTPVPVPTTLTAAPTSGTPVTAGTPAATVATPPTPAPTTGIEPTASPAPSGGVAAVEVTPQGALLTGIGQSQTLTAVARDTAGQVIQAAMSWSSSDPAIVSVDANGRVQAVAGVGTALITAAAGDIQGPPAYVTVAKPVAGALLINDSQIVSGPNIVDATAEPTADSPYEVVLRGVTGLTSGSILIGAEALPVAGRVISTIPDGADLRVRLVVVPPTQLFTDFAFKDTVDLSTGTFDIPADLAAAYDVQQTGSTFDFTPKATAQTTGAVLASLRSGEPAPAPPPVLDGVAQGTRAMPPFDGCTSTIGFGSGLPVPLALSAPPSFTFTAVGEVTREATPAGTKITVRGTPTFGFTSVLEIRSAFEAKIECKVTLAVQKFRAPGWAGVFFGGDVEFGVGFEIGGKVTLFSAKVGGTAEIRPTLEASLDCRVGADCTLTGDVTAVTSATPTLEAPSLDQAQFEPSVSLFGFISLEAGNADIEPLQFKAIEAKAGAKLTAGLALEALQMSNTNASTGRSKYALSFAGEVGPGIKLGELLTYLGLSEAVPLKLTFEVALGESPTGAVTADSARYLPGDRATITVNLAPASTLFPSGGFYNVKRVVVVRANGLSTEVLAEQTATPGQTDFTLTFDAPGLLNADELFAFVVTKLLPLDPPKLEIGAAIPPIAATSDAFAEVRVQVDPHGSLRQTRQGTDFVDFTPAALDRGDSSPTASARSRGAYEAHVVVNAEGVEITTNGHLDASGRCGETGCGEPQAEARASLDVNLTATGDFVYTLEATLNAGGHAHPCATVAMKLRGDAPAENLKVTGPSTAIDPGCNSGEPGHRHLATDGVLHASGNVNFKLDVVLQLIDPGSARTDVLHADWDIVLTIRRAGAALATDAAEAISGAAGNARL